ncbi:hypothetical protein [Vulcanibacillus modesticaldus]|uniref:hypothetical protein n=1 Tax=Vulcanibacillus modesticaldus TaxID=337097 RepID=UPI00159F343F|nr:hypothetical protein [Vulcanibacillus modesticaldus]
MDKKRGKTLDSKGEYFEFNIADKSHQNIKSMNDENLKPSDLLKKITESDEY